VSGRLGIALAVAATIALAGCGDEEGPQIPEDQSNALRGQLQDIKRQVETGEACTVSLSELQLQVGRLPRNLDEDVRQSVEDGVEHLTGLVNEECEQMPQQPEQTDTEEETTPTETVPPETTPPETEELPPPTETAPEEEDGGGEGLPGGGEGPGSGGIGPGAEKRGRDKRGKR
jgi:hypothetical protein